MLLRGRNLSRVARLSLGLAASGAAALCLGGSALAAPAPGQVSLPPAGSTSDTHISTTETTVVTTEATTSQSDQTVNQTGASSVSAGSGPGPSGGPAAGATGGQTIETNQAPAVLAATPTTPTATAGGSSAASPTAADVHWTEVPAPAAVHPPEPAWRTAALRPVIVGSAAAPSDLASALPSLPSPEPAKGPTKSTGLLGNLTLVLAGIVVPDFLTLLPVARPASLVPLALLLTLVFLTAPIGLTYGRWLRRAGYVTAARSDVAPLFSLATPTYVSYVRELWFSHPVAHFCGVDNH
jgi:hypothetical protein